MLRGPDSVERLFDLEVVPGRPHFDVAIHLSAGSVVIEGEPSSGEHRDSTGLVRSMIGRLDQCADLTAFFRRGRAPDARSHRDSTRVHGLPLRHPTARAKWWAKSCKPGIGTFLGLRYPASDIPQQARELYKRNLLRVIADVNAAPVPIVPQLDRDRSATRPVAVDRYAPVSPIHIEYLKQHGRRRLDVDLDPRRGRAVGAVRLPSLFAALPELRAARR